METRSYFHLDYKIKNVLKGNYTEKFTTDFFAYFESTVENMKIKKKRRSKPFFVLELSII